MARSARWRWTEAATSPRRRLPVELFGKAVGRVGDTPIIGVGTWADQDIAISWTGTGEYFLRSGGALTVANRFKLAGDSLEQALWHMLDDV